MQRAFIPCKLVSSGLMNLSNSISSIADTTSWPCIVFRLAFPAIEFEQDVAYKTNTDAA